MCLCTIDKKTKQAKEGYKIFERYNNKLYSVYMTSKGCFKTGEWIYDDEVMNIETSNGEFYKTGFHFYFDKTDAMQTSTLLNNYNYIVKKNKVKNIVASGKGFFDQRVGVARSMFIED